MKLRKAGLLAIRVMVFRLLLMHLGVHCKVVRSGEASGANQALEWFDSGMSPDVSLQLVSSNESPMAVRPITSIRLLSSVNFEVSFQMRYLRVDFVTA